VYIDNLPAAPERGASNTALVTINTGVPISIRVVALGKPVQVEPMKPKLKQPGSKRLTLKYDNLLSILLKFCFQCQLVPLHLGLASAGSTAQYANVYQVTVVRYTVGRCSLTPSNPR